MHGVIRNKVTPFLIAFVLAISMFFILGTSNSYAAVDEITSCPGQSIERTYYSTFSSFSDVQSSDTSVVIPQLTGSGLTISNRVYYSGTFSFYLVGPGTAEVTLYAGGFNAGTIEVTVNEHEWSSEYAVDYYPSCAEEGMESIHCKLCGRMKDGSARVIAKTPHTYGDWTITKEATCTEPGTREQLCVLCGDMNTEEIAATGHKWMADYTIDKDSTCTAEGVESIHCSICDAVKEGSERTIAKRDHAYGDWSIAKAATCADDGLKEKVCVNCNDKVTEVIPATGHQWKSEYTVDKDATCTEEGSESIHCSVCDAVKEESSRAIPAGHKWDSEYTIDKAPTYREEGSESIHCSVCGAIKEGSARPIEKLNAAEKKGSDGTALGEGASVEAAEAAISGMTSDNDLPGAVFGKLQRKSSKQTKTSVTITWKKVPGAKSYVIYGNKCGKTIKMKKLAAAAGASMKFTNVAGAKVKKGTYYKFMVVALDGENNVVSSSKIIHVATKGGKVGNIKKVTTKAKKNKVSIKTGKTFKLGAKQVPVSKKLKVKTHRKLTYETSDPSIATVSSKGAIKGKKKGTCYVYVYAQNGVFAKIKVTIK